MNGFLHLMIIALSLLWSSHAAATGEPQPRRLFIVHAYGETNPTALPQERGALRALARAGWREGENLQVQRFFMDTKKRHTSPAQIHRQAQRALTALQRFHPDVVLTIDDNAFTGVAMALLDTDIPVVFSGINTPPELYAEYYPFMEHRAHPGHNLTGIYENIHIHRALAVIREVLQLKPQDRIAIVLDDSPTGYGMRHQVLKDLEKLPFRHQVDVYTVSHFDEYRRLITHLNATSTVKALYAGVLKLPVSDGETWNADQIIRWTLRNNHIPEMTLSFSLVRQGYFGSIALDMERMGEQAGHRLAAILAGQNAGELAIEDARYYGLVFNLHRARTLGVTIPTPLLLAADKLYE